MAILNITRCKIQLKVNYSTPQYYTSDVTEMQVPMPNSQQGHATLKCQSLAQRFIAGQATNQEAHALKTFPNPKSSQRSPFPGKEGSGVGRGCKRLGVRCFVLEGRSWSVNNAPVTKHMLFPGLTRKGQVPRHSCLPLRSSGG